MGRKIKIRRDGAWVPADEGSLDNVIQSTTVDKISASTTAPSSPTPGDIWFDSSDLPEELAPTSIVWKETPTGTVDGTNTSFTTSSPYISGSLQVFVNGLAQSGFTTETAAGSGNFSLDVAPQTGDDVKVQYQIRTVATGNADTVDGFHANATPTPNNIPVLNGDGKLPATAVDFTKATLGYAEISSSQDKPTGSGPFAVSGLSLNINIPTGGARVKITAWAPNFENTGPLNSAKLSIHDGTVGVGTVIADVASTVHENGYYTSVTVIAVRELDAGSHSINVGMGSTGVSTLRLNAYAGNRAFLLVELI